MENAANRCRRCQQSLDPSDRFCRACGASVAATLFGRLFQPPMLTPAQAGSYWRNFFRPFFITASVLFGMFFLATLCLIVIWFFMFRL
jgi:hypothetical protein